MRKEAHTKAAEHHETAAKSHRTVQSITGGEISRKDARNPAKPIAHSKTAHEHFGMAQGKNQSAK